MTLPKFYYANGTAVIANFFGFVVGAMGGGSTLHVKGVNGEFYTWDGAITNDPFPLLLDPTLWQYQRVPYPASALDIGTSIRQGVDWTVNQILATPGPFALGGYSQGAAVMSNVYNECRQGRLASRRNDLRAMICFGNPMRETGRTFPGSSGYAGAFDVPDSTTGSHGCFPTRLKNTEDFVYEFTMPGEVITGVGDSTVGSKWVSAAGKLLSNDLVGALLDILSSASGIFGLGGKTVADTVGTAAGGIDFIDPSTGDAFSLSGGGHVRYPFNPPPNADGTIPSSGDTCYQIAAKYLNKVGAQIYDQMNPTVVAPITPPTYQWFSSLANG